MAAERTSSYWNNVQHKSQQVKDLWEIIVSKEVEEDMFTMNSTFDYLVEKKCTGGLVLLAPMMDVFMKEIGQTFLNKLRRGKATNL